MMIIASVTTFVAVAMVLWFRDRGWHPAGAIVAENRNLTVWVSPVGAPHLVDPSRLEASARRLYGERFDALWGGLTPIPEENIRIADGEVSPYLTEALEPGDPLELRGPIGGWFVWPPGSAAPLLLVAGGIGITPLVSMAERLAALITTPQNVRFAEVMVNRIWRRLMGAGIVEPPVWLTFVNTGSGSPKARSKALRSARTFGLS